MLLTPETDSWAPVERQIAPFDISEARILPSFRTKTSRVGPVEILAPVHMIDRVRNRHSASNQNRRTTVRSATSRECRCFSAKPDIYWRWRV